MMVNKLHLFLISLKHLANCECYHGAKVEYKGSSESWCGMDHHPLLHWSQSMIFWKNESICHSWFRNICNSPHENNKSREWGVLMVGGIEWVSWDVWRGAASELCMEPVHKDCGGGGGGGEMA